MYVDLERKRKSVKGGSQACRLHTNHGWMLVIFIHHHPWWMVLIFYHECKFINIVKFSSFGQFHPCRQLHRYCKFHSLHIFIHAQVSFKWYNSFVSKNCSCYQNMFVLHANLICEHKFLSSTIQLLFIFILYTYPY